MIEKRTKDSVQVGEPVWSSIARDDPADPTDQTDVGATFEPH